MSLRRQSLDSRLVESMPCVPPSLSEKHRFTRRQPSDVATDRRPLTRIRKRRPKAALSRRIRPHVCAAAGIFAYGETEILRERPEAYASTEAGAKNEAFRCFDLCGSGCI